MVYAILLIAILLTVIAATRMRQVPLRRIAAYSGMQNAVSEAVESGRTVHISLGSSAVRDDTTITALAAAEIAYHLLVKAVPGDKTPVITLSDPVTLSIAQDRIRRAYKVRDLMARYRGGAARWYPQGPLSLAFAAGAGAAILEDDASANILVGRFGPELMLIAENTIRYDRFLVAHSDTIAGQAVAYAVSETPLIGEELYAGAAYLERTPVHVGGVATQDILRYLIVILLIILAVFSLLGVNI